ncbi:hypothetical protein Mal64_12860 [Pseudobythopirellula maris]|uniref:DUF2617 domain-containing protein n=1 Tax=Pseudobythopirellula maris TaxID=2527991 RepID=A0A5C5ZV25_9BACT|nr:DUF2617 family protein [Pseudobythopirellula maris]TWT90888.1 hypothetical protein Mal64_12860 [Pseudobythopirellula maris]
MLTVRPKVAGLVFQLYGRSLHPELFEICRSKRIVRQAYEATISITGAGHLVTWKRDGILLTEAATSANQPLPQKRRLMSHRMSGDQSDRVRCHGGIVYEASFSHEAVSSQAFYAYQQELDLSGVQSGAAADGLLHRFQPSVRFDVGAVSYVHVESRERSLAVQAFHTFPDDCTIVKSQSVFRLPNL